MKTWDQFYPFVVTEVPGCPDPTIDHYLRLAARDFCTRSGAWIEWIDSFTANGAINRWDYDLSGQQDLVKITRALRNGEELKVKAGGALPSDWEIGDSDKYQVRDTLIHFDAAEFMVFPLPVAGDVITCEMVFMPSIDATGIGDTVFSNYADDIASGAKARILMMPGQAWTSPQLASAHRSWFEASIHLAANVAFARTGRSARKTAKAPL